MPLAPTAAAATPEQVPFAFRFFSALPDLGTAWLFAWCWKNPLGWHPQLASQLGQVMLMEFWVVHSSIFLGALIGGEASRSAKAVAGLILVCFYIPVAGGFAWFNNALWPFAAFAWLLLSRVATGVLGRGPGDYEKKRMRYYWANGAGCYILFVFAAVLLPIPAFGFAHARVPWTGWSITPQEVIAWGFLYYAALAAMKLLENPASIQDMDEHQAA